MRPLPNPTLQLASANCDRDAARLEATVRASGTSVDFYCPSGSSRVRLRSCDAHLQHLNAIATSGTNYPTPPPTADPTYSPTTTGPTEVGATWSPTPGPLADVTPPSAATAAAATTLQPDPDEQQASEDGSDGIQTHVVVIMGIMGLVIVAFIVYTVYSKRKGHAPLAPNQPDNTATVANPMYNAQPQAAPTVGNDNDDGAYEPARTLNPQYQPTLPERMDNRVYAEIKPNEESLCASYAALGGDQQVYDQFYEPPPDRHAESSA